MSIPHAASGQVISVEPYRDQLNEHRTVALFKSNEIEVIRLVLAQGKTMPPHKVTGEITIQCIEGLIDVDVQGTSTLVPPGHLVYLTGNVPHSVTALESASVLLTIVVGKLA